MTTVFFGRGTFRISRGIGITGLLSYSLIAAYIRLYFEIEMYEMSTGFKAHSVEKRDFRHYIWLKCDFPEN